MLGNAVQHCRDRMDVFLETAEGDAYDTVLIFKTPQMPHADPCVYANSTFMPEREDRFYPAEAQE